MHNAYWSNFFGISKLADSKDFLPEFVLMSTIGSQIYLSLWVNYNEWVRDHFPITCLDA
jgi:hypothetical protein